MANPVLTDKRFTESADAFEPGWAAPTRTAPAPPAPPVAPSQVGLMTAGGTFAKTFFLWFLLVVAGAFGWSRVTENAAGELTVPAWIWVSLIVALVLALVCIFAPRAAPFAAPGYALAEGVFLGAISRLYEAQWSGIVVQAVLATLATFLVCLVLYSSGAVRVTNKFIFVVVAATAGIFLLYIATFLLAIFGVDLSFWNDPTPLGIGISVAICFVAALNLFIDFEFIRRMVLASAPKPMEWYGAVGITITIVWLYLEILRLLSLLRR
jgi:uncharacterized YccA/Bax inhibitor family protein